MCKGVDLLKMNDKSRIGNFNWISGSSAFGERVFFEHDINRKSELVLGSHSALTSRHLLDCSGSISIGDFTILAGFRSQILTHSIDLRKSRQSSGPVRIGSYCFIGTGCIILKDSSLPDYSVLGAGSLLNKKHTDNHTLYGGVPACALKKLPDDYVYFSREEGYVS